MAKSPAASPIEGAAKKETKLTLDEFCLRKSAPENKQRPELLGAFAFVERRAGRVKDTESAYEGRFVEFQNTPV